MKNKSQFLNALKKEITFENDFINRKEPVETIYFGGGTPSLLSSNEINDILEQLHKEFPIVSDAEITLEANPDDINSNVVKKWMNSGINRLSIGIQSFVEQELQWMNRAHDAKQAINCIDILQDCGLYNFSVDLIFGGPYQSDQALENNIKIISEKNIPHVSCYALTVEEKTALYQFIKTKKSPPVSNEKQAQQFLLTMKWLDENGYEQYEISNYAKPNCRSRHNSSYWQGKPYWGFGPSAHSFDGINKRRWNVSNNSMYINNILNGAQPFEEECLSEIQQLNEYIMTTIRTIEGIDLKFVSNRFGLEKANILLHSARPFILNAHIIAQFDVLSLSPTGKLMADGISADLFFE